MLLFIGWVAAQFGACFNPRGIHGNINITCSCKTLLLPNLPCCPVNRLTILAMAFLFWPLPPLKGAGAARAGAGTGVPDIASSSLHLLDHLLAHEGDCVTFSEPIQKSGIFVRHRSCYGQCAVCISDKLFVFPSPCHQYMHYAWFSWEYQLFLKLVYRLQRRM